MRIAVGTPTGNVGRAVTGHLLDEGADLVLVARDAEKVREFAGRGAEIVVGSLDDEATVIGATKGTDALFWVTPPDYAAPDVREAQRRFGRVAAKAVRTNAVPRVVNLSSIGAHLGEGTGPIDGLHDVEGILEDVAENIVHLRPGLFFENFLMQVEAIRMLGSVFMPVSGDVRIPMIATTDIARVAADYLLDTGWSGRIVRGLHGPADLTFREAASALSRGIGRPVTFVRVKEEQVRGALSGLGVGRDMAEKMLQLYRAIDRGTLKSAEERTKETTTPTDLANFAQEVLAPMVRG